MDVPKEQFSTLLNHGLYSSAQILGCFAISSTSTNSETSPHLRAESLVLFGDSLFRVKEYRRAIQLYKQALQYHRILPKQHLVTPPTTRSSFSAANRSSSPNSVNSLAINESEVKFKIATCHSSLGESRAALAEMEGVSSKSRNLEMNLMMAKLYRNSRRTRAAIGCFKECVRSCPYVFEAIIALAELGAAAKDIVSLFPQTPSRSGRPPFDHFDSSRWLLRYVEAQCCIALNDYKGQAMGHRKALLIFSGNIFLFRLGQALLIFLGTFSYFGCIIVTKIYTI